MPHSVLTSMTLNDLQLPNRGFLVNFWLQNSELRQDGWIWTKITWEQKLVWALAHLMGISSDFLLLQELYSRTCNAMLWLSLDQFTFTSQLVLGTQFILKHSSFICIKFLLHTMYMILDALW